MLVATCLILALLDFPLATRDADPLPGFSAVLPAVIVFLLAGRFSRRRQASAPARPDPVAAQLNEGIVCYEEGDYAKAEEILRRALGGPVDESPVTRQNATIYRMLALSCGCQNKSREGLRFCKRALEMYDRLWLSWSQEAIYCRADLAWLHALEGQLDEAETILRDLRSKLEKGPARHDSAMVMTLYQLAQVRRERGDLREAEQLLRQSLEQYEQGSWKNDVDHNSILTQLWQVCLSQGKHDEAVEALEQEIAVAERCLGPEHPRLVEGLVALWHVSLKSLRYLKAETACRKALAIEEQRLGPEHPAVGVLLALLLVVLERQRRYRDAAEVAGRQLTILAAAPPGDDRDLLARRLGEYACYLRSRGRTWDADCVESALILCSTGYASHVRPERNWPDSWWN